MKEGSVYDVREAVKWKEKRKKGKGMEQIFSWLCRSLGQFILTNKEYYRREEGDDFSFSSLTKAFFHPLCSLPIE